MAAGPPLSEPDDLAAVRHRMVQRDLARRGIADRRVLDAMAAVPRHLFVAGDMQGEAYADKALPIGSQQTISQPYIVARMAELAAIRPEDRILEVGAGSGYASAVLAELGDSVVAAEVRPELAAEARRHLADLGYANVEVVTGDGLAAARDRGPFDVISVPAAPSDIPAGLEDALAEGGRLVIPVGDRFRQHLWLVIREGGDFVRQRFEPVAFVPLV